MKIENMGRAVVLSKKLEQYSSIRSAVGKLERDPDLTTVECYLWNHELHLTQEDDKLIATLILKQLEYVNNKRIKEIESEIESL